MKQQNGLTELHVGIDDTDSRLGGCTTYTAALVFEKLWSIGLVPTDFPWLVRLNPNIPWKTRGNGALAVHFLVEEGNVGEARDLILEIVRRTSDPKIPSTDPAVALLSGPMPYELTEFSMRALNDIIKVREAQRVAKHIGAETHLLKGSRGLVGALAAIGADLETHTFEIIAYRERENVGTKRRLDPVSVREMDSRFEGRTFNNIDHETGRVLITPHGPDPVLFGIRGEDPLSLLEAFQVVRAEEPVERVMIFKTNHGTDAHFTLERKVQDLRRYQSSVVSGIVEKPPIVLRGGHVVFQLRDKTGVVDCAAYEPTGQFRMVVKDLVPGDYVKVYGGVRRGPGQRLTVNVEKLEIISLSDDIRWENPRCPTCDRRCESEGRNQGYRCRKCGLQYPRGLARKIARPRYVRETVYVPPPRANRHLTKPASRYLNEKNQSWSNEEPIGVYNSHWSAEQVFVLENLIRTVQPASLS